MAQPTSKTPKFGQKGQTAKVTLDSLSAGWEKCTVAQALDEVARELAVRERLYVRWVEEGKHSPTEATDRLQRMIRAASILQVLNDDPGLWNAVATQLDDTLVPGDDGETASPVPNDEDLPI